MMSNHSHFPVLVPVCSQKPINNCLSGAAPEPGRDDPEPRSLPEPLIPDYEPDDRRRRYRSSIPREPGLVQMISRLFSWQFLCRLPPLPSPSLSSPNVFSRRQCT